MKRNIQTRFSYLSTTLYEKKGIVVSFLGYKNLEGALKNIIQDFTVTRTYNIDFSYINTLFKFI